MNGLVATCSRSRAASHRNLSAWRRGFHVLRQPHFLMLLYVMAVLVSALAATSAPLGAAGVPDSTVAGSPASATSDSLRPAWPHTPQVHPSGSNRNSLPPKKNRPAASDSSELSLPALRSAVHDELQAVIARIDSIAKNVKHEPWKDLLTDFATQAAYERVVNPLLSLFLSFILGWVGWKVRKGASKDAKEADPLLARIGSLLLLLSLGLLLLGIALAFASAVSTMVTTLAESFPSPRGFSLPASLNIALLIVTALALTAIVVLMFVRSGPYPMGALPTAATPVSPTSAHLLIPAFVLALILLLLPYPADALIMPFILNHFLLALMEVLPLHPDQRVLEFVRRHFKVLCYFAFFGVWLQFFDSIQLLSAPLTDGLLEWLQRGPWMDRGHSDWPWLVRLGWRAAPELLALLIAVPMSNPMIREARNRGWR